MSEEEKMTVRDLSDKELEEGWTEIRDERGRRLRLKHPYTHACISCGLQVTEETLSRIEYCKCGGTDFIPLKEEE